MSEPDDVGARIAKEMTAICTELPARMNVVGILRDAHARFVAAAPDAPAEFISEKVVEVLREIATHAVEQFTRRTGQAFLWVDDPPMEEPEAVFSFSVDNKGNVVF